MVYCSKCGPKIKILTMYAPTAEPPFIQLASAIQEATENTIVEWKTSVLAYPMAE